MDLIVPCQFRLAQPFCLLGEMAAALRLVVRKRLLSKRAEIDRVWAHHHHPRRLVLQLVLLPRVPALFIPRPPVVVTLRVPAVAALAVAAVQLAAQGKRSSKFTVTLFDINHFLQQIRQGCYHRRRSSGWWTNHHCN